MEDYKRLIVPCYLSLLVLIAIFIHVIEYITAKKYICNATSSPILIVYKISSKKKKKTFQEAF